VTPLDQIVEDWLANRKMYGNFFGIEFSWATTYGPDDMNDSLIYLRGTNYKVARISNQDNSINVCNWNIYRFDPRFFEKLAYGLRLSVKRYLMSLNNIEHQKYTPLVGRLV
jgi:hypothetical protein